MLDVQEAPATGTNEELEDTIEALAQFNKLYESSQRSMQAMDSRNKADYRIIMGYSSGDEEKSRKIMSARAAVLVDLSYAAAKAGCQIPQQYDRAKVEKALVDHPEDLRLFIALGEHVMALAPGRAAAKMLMDRYHTAISDEAQKLPVAEWWGSVKYNGWIGLGRIIAITGDLNNYSKPSKVYRRMGIGCIDGVRQGAGTKGNAEKAAKHGYSKVRRTAMYNVCDPHFKTPKSRLSVFRPFYDVERARQDEMHADKITGEKGCLWSKKRLMLRSRRAMERQILRHLWLEWTGAEPIEPRVV